MSLADDHQSNEALSIEVSPLADASEATPAKGSDRVRSAPDTKRVQAEEINGIVERAERVVEPEDKQTREMDPEIFRALLRGERKSPAPVAAAPEVAGAAAPAPTRGTASTAELMASLDSAFADSAPEVAPPAPIAEAVPVAVAPSVKLESSPVKKPALIVPDPRPEPRRAEALPPLARPIAQPSAQESSGAVEPWVALAMAPTSVLGRARIDIRLLASLAIAIVVAIAIVLFR